MRRCRNDLGNVDGVAGETAQLCKRETQVAGRLALIRIDANFCGRVMAKVTQLMTYSTLLR